MNTNLLIETLSDMQGYCLTKEDVLWVGSSNGEFAISWDEFEKLAKNVNYDSGFGGQEVARDLVVVFNNGSWFKRYEYGGSESWGLEKLPQKQELTRSFEFVTGENSWATIKEHNSQ